MEFSYLQKFGGGLLIVAWLIWGSNVIGNALVPVYEEPASTTVASAAPAPAPKEAKLEDVKPLLASASADAGAKVFRKCQACHNIEKGAGTKVGPDLYDVLSRGRADFKGFAYSDALKKLGGKWTYDDLNHFLFKPKEFVPGTKMGFAGLKKVKDRANIIAFLRQHDDSPPPLP